MKRIFLNRSSVVVLLILSFFIFGGAVKYFQSAKLNNNGTGTMSITYSAKAADVRKNNNMIGNLPFTVELAKEYFSSAGTQFVKAIFYKDKNDSSIQTATVEINITDMNKINASKAFANVNASWVKADSGMVFRWLFTPSHKTANDIESFQVVADFESNVKSTNGVLTGKQVKWFVFGNKMDPRGAFFVATIDSDGTTKAGKNTTPEGNKGTTTDGKTAEKEKSCGLFGFELPLLILGWIAVSRKRSV